MFLSANVIFKSHSLLTAMFAPFSDDNVSTENVSIQTETDDDYVNVDNIKINISPAKGDVLFQGIDFQWKLFIASVMSLFSFASELRPHLRKYSDFDVKFLREIVLTKPPRECFAMLQRRVKFP